VSTGPDHLDLWCQTRTWVPWESVNDPRPSTTERVIGTRDGVVHFIQTTEHDRDPYRARRLRTALVLVRSDLSAGRTLDFPTMRRWQSHVLGIEHPPFRTGLAFAKRGRERYGLDDRTRQRFEECLQQADDAAVPLPARAARTYLDGASSTPSRTATPVRHCWPSPSSWPGPTSYWTRSALSSGSAAEPTRRRGTGRVGVDASDCGHGRVRAAVVC
jgi:hypothetical protein